MRRFAVGLFALLSLTVGAASASVQVPVRVSVGADTVTFTVGLRFDSVRFHRRVDTVTAVDTLWCVTGGTCTSAPPPDTTTPPVGRGTPYGPFGLWCSVTAVCTGPAPFTASIGANQPTGIVTQITAARAIGQQLVLCMAGCAHGPVTTNGAFDLGKWKTLLSTFNTAAIRAAVATAVQDGTVLGNSLIDEPEHASWGGVPTRAMLDGMAAYAKQIFPTLAMGVNHGPGGYKWDPTTHFRTVDYVLNQYAWRIGPIATWLGAVRSQFTRDSVTLGFSMNVLGGGVLDKDGTWTCDGPGQAGKGPFAPTCRATADSVRVWGGALAQAGGCLLVMWKYDEVYFGRADNQQAFRDVASAVATAPRKTCHRP